MKQPLFFAALVLLLLLLSVYVLDWRLLSFGAQGLLTFLAQFSAPDLQPEFLRRVARLSLETLAMAVLATLMSALFAALLARRARGWLRLPLKLLFNALRSIPELLFAGLLVIAVGLGPTAGILALTLHTTGVLARLFTETLENAPREPYEALRLSGAPERSAFWFGLWPVVETQWLAYTLYRGEMNLRAAAVLGVVGAGGLGQQLYVALNLFQYPRASTLILATLILILLTEGLSRYLRAARFPAAEVE
jgi:phosphonate transport system permease protein